MVRYAILGAAALILGAGGAHAQAPQPPATLPMQMISLNGALAVLAAAEQQAQSLHAPASLAVVDAAGDLVAFVRMDGARPAGARLAIGEARSAARFRQPTQALENAINGGRTAAETAGAIAMQGGVPLTAGGAIIGAIGVSGTDKDSDVKIANAAAGSIR